MQTDAVADTVGEEAAQPGEQLVDDLNDQHRPIAILDIGKVRLGTEQQTRWAAILPTRWGAWVAGRHRDSRTSHRFLPVAGGEVGGEERMQDDRRVIGEFGCSRDRGRGLRSRQRRRPAICHDGLRRPPPVIGSFLLRAALAHWILSTT
jgi:hypothetical protein